MPATAIDTVFAQLEIGARKQLVGPQVPVIEARNGAEFNWKAISSDQVHDDRDDETERIEGIERNLLVGWPELNDKENQEAKNKDSNNNKRKRKEASFWPGWIVQIQREPAIKRWCIFRNIGNLWKDTRHHPHLRYLLGCSWDVFSEPLWHERTAAVISWSVLLLSYWGSKLRDGVLPCYVIGGLDCLFATRDRNSQGPASCRCWSAG